MSTEAKSPYAAKYPFKAAVFCTNIAIEDEIAIQDARVIGEYLGTNGVGVVFDGAGEGLLGELAGVVHEKGGELHSIGLSRKEKAPSERISFYESYRFLWEQQRRLIEIGDVFVALPGGLEALSEIVDVQLIQQLGDTQHPLILVGEYAKNYKLVLDFIERHGMAEDLSGRLIYASDGAEAVRYIDAHLKMLRASGYVNRTYYPALPPEGIFEHVKQNQNPFKALFEKLVINVLPNVYPSNRFRSSRALAQVVASVAKGKRIADMACGPGVMGLVAAAHGATHVVQVDINPTAVENARMNARDLGMADKMDIYEGDMFEPLTYRYLRYFDLMFFNPPFHRDASAYKNDKLMYAFYGHGNAGGAIDMFLMRAKEHLAPGGAIIIVFSNKDPEYLAFMEESFVRYGYSFKVSITNADTGADTRLYHVTPNTAALPERVQGTLRLGVVLAESGVARNDGQLMRRGVDLAVEELKKQGVTIELGTADDQSSERGAVLAVADMIEKFKPDALIGPTWSAFIDAAAPMLNEAKVPFFTPATSSALLSARTPLRLSGAYDDRAKAGRIVDFLKEQAVLRVLYIRRENRWGEVHAHLLQEIGAEFGIEIVERRIQETFSSNEEQQIAEEVEKGGFGAIVIDNYDDVFYRLMQAWKNRRIGIPCLCTLSISEALRVELKKLQVMQPVFLLDAGIPPSFAEKYYHTYGETLVHRYAFNAYAGVHILAQAFTSKTEGETVKDRAVRMRATIEGEVWSYAPSGDLIEARWHIESVPL